MRDFHDKTLYALKSARQPPAHNYPVFQGINLGRAEK
jgi:hypothetical protein